MAGKLAQPCNDSEWCINNLAVCVCVHVFGTRASVCACGPFFHIFYFQMHRAESHVRMKALNFIGCFSCPRHWVIFLNLQAIRYNKFNNKVSETKLYFWNKNWLEVLDLRRESKPKVTEDSPNFGQHNYIYLCYLNVFLSLSFNFIYLFNENYHCTKPQARIPLPPPPPHTHMRT